MWILNGALNFLPNLWIVLLLPVFSVAVFKRRSFTMVAAVPLVIALLLINGSSMMLVASANASANGCASPSLRIATANVLMSNERLDVLAEDILREAPDVVVFEELYHSLETFSPALAAAYPYRISTEQQWVTLASRLPLQDARRLPLAEAVPGREPLTAAVEVNGQTVRILAVHAQAPMNGETYRLHRAQYELLEREAAQADGPLVAVGDLNATVLSPFFARFMVRTGLRAALEDGDATYYPRQHIGLRIDHVLVRNVDVCGERVFDLTGSDHRGVVADLRLG